MTPLAGSTRCDPFLGKQSLSVLAKMGFSEREPRLGPHRHHGVAARTRLCVAGKTMTTPAQHRHQHHKERATIQQVNDLAEIAREIESFAKAGRRVPVAVWEKYDRVNKRHNKHEEMIAIAAEVRCVNRRKRRVREPEQPNEERARKLDGTSACPGDKNVAPDNKHSLHLLQPKRCPDNRCGVAPLSFKGGAGCTFGSGRGDKHIADASQGRSAHAPVLTTQSRSSSWGTFERDKLNELYWELGRPPRRGEDAVREHFCRYTQRHCMVFPLRSPKEVIERLKLMFRYNAMKEPNEREHWLRLNALKGFFPTADAADLSKSNHVADKMHAVQYAKNAAAATPTSTKVKPLVDFSALAESREPNARPRSSVRPLTEQPVESSEPLFRRSGGVEGAPAIGRLSTTAASYAAEAIAAASIPFSNSRLRPSGAVAMSPFYDPIRPSSPAWGFGEASDSCPGSRGCSRGSRSGADSRGGSRSGSRVTVGGGVRLSGRAGYVNGCVDDGDNGPEETELLDYTSLGPQTASHRATSPAHAFPREGLGSENLSMFQADKRPEPGPGSFRPNLSATSTHPGPRCGVLIGRPGSQGGGGGGGGGAGAGASGSSGREAGVVRGAGSQTPGPGQYSTWDSIGKQILSTRPSSPVVAFATGEWDLR